MKLKNYRIESGFSGSDNSAIKVDFLFSGHVPQAELAEYVRRAVGSYAELVDALEAFLADPNASKCRHVNLDCARAALAKAKGDSSPVPFVS